jgi:hypothetical protein
MDSNNAYHDIASVQLLRANIYAISDFNSFLADDSWQQADVI